MLCTQLWIASERALALDNFSHAVTLEVVQTLILLSYRAISLDPKGWFHQAPILAMAIRLGMSIGLSSVAADAANAVPPPGLFRRELWRRVWFNLVYLDWRFSVPMGETYFVSAYHYSTAWPANCEWGEMRDGEVFRPRGRGVFTSASMFLAKVHNAERVKDLCDTLNHAARGGPTDVSRLYYDHEVAVNDNIAREPPCLIQADPVLEGADMRVKWARIGHTLELDYRAIQIHRSFLVADFRDARARAVCVDTAGKMLRCFVEGKDVDAPSAWWWYGYTACVVLMMEQYYADLTPPPDVAARLAQKLDEIIGYVAMQRNYEEVTVRAWDGILILETLISELQKRRIAAATATAASTAASAPSAGTPSTATQSPDTARLKRPYDAISTSAPTTAPISTEPNPTPTPTTTTTVSASASAPTPTPSTSTTTTTASIPPPTHPQPPHPHPQTPTPPQTVTRVPSSSPIHAFRKWILNVMPFLKLALVPGMPAAHPRQRDMDGVFWDAILDIDTELHKSSRRGVFGKS